jgi:septum site-determining protein MinD
VKGNIFVVTSGKGGVGKTTTTANLGVALARLGKQVVLVDADIGLRNLDLVLGLEKRIVYDVVDLAEARCQARQALIKDKRVQGLFLLPAAQTKDKESVSEAQMARVVHTLGADFDVVLIDCPAGIEHGFRNAVAGADEAIVVTVPEVSAIRDADRVLGMLGTRRARLMVNRVRPEMVRSGDMLSVDDVAEILGKEILGVVPDDEEIIDTTNRGQPVSLDAGRRLAAIYSTMARRLLGEDVPALELTEDGLWNRLRRIMVGQR